MKKIIVVDDSPFNLTVCQKALKDLYDVYLVRTAESMFEILGKNKIDLILLDVEMPGIHGYDAIKMLKDNNAYKDIPVIFFSAMDDEQSECQGFDLGAVDYVHKPIISALLTKRIDTHIALSEKKRALIELKESNTQLSKEVSKALDKISKLSKEAIESEDTTIIKQNLSKIKKEADTIWQQVDDSM
jgi:DNA-binding response OmpR family regulator